MVLLVLDGYGCLFCGRVVNGLARHCYPVAFVACVGYLEAVYAASLSWRQFLDCGLVVL
jgi:hypothetical protein